MFNLKKLFAALAFFVAGLSCVNASEFAGPYAGVKLGENWSSASGEINKDTHATFFPGLTAGYNFDIPHAVIGAEAFADFHHGSATYKDGGIDLKVGVPFNSIMPYGRIGFTGTWPSARLHYGVGVEYKLAKQWSIAGEWTADSGNKDNTQRKNNSVTLGVHYFFF